MDCYRQALMQGLKHLVSLPSPQKIQEKDYPLAEIELKKWVGILSQRDELYFVHDLTKTSVIRYTTFSVILNQVRSGLTATLGVWLTLNKDPLIPHVLESDDFSQKFSTMEELQSCLASLMRRRLLYSVITRVA